MGYRFHGIAFYQSLRLDARSEVAMQVQAMIDKTMNCTAVERQESTGPVYGDYMEGMRSMVFNECIDLSWIKDFK